MRKTNNTKNESDEQLREQTKMKNRKKLYISSVSVGLLSLVIGFSGSPALFAASPAPVDLLSAGNFVALTETGIYDGLEVVVDQARRHAAKESKGARMGV